MCLNKYHTSTSARVGSEHTSSKNTRHGLRWELTAGILTDTLDISVGVFIGWEKDNTYLYIYIHNWWSCKYVLLCLTCLVNLDTQLLFVKFEYNTCYLWYKMPSLVKQFGQIPYTIRLHWRETPERNAALKPEMGRRNILKIYPTIQLQGVQDK